MSSKKYFDEVASQWDEMRESFFSDAVREKSLSIANVQRGKTAADIGAGTGFISEGLVKRGLRVIAVDQSEAMLRKMKRKFARFKGIVYRVGESEKLPIQNRTVDYVFANMYLHHVESPLKAIKEMTRILKPNGKLVITDMDEHNFEFLKREHNDRWLGFKRKDVERWFKESGLKKVIVDSIDEDCCAPSQSGDQMAEISVFVASGKK